MRPGQTLCAEADAVILPSGPGRYILQISILGNEIPTPLLMEHVFEIAGPVTAISEAEAYALIEASSDEDEDD
ncbi:hypothetical protein [Ralstonia pseudosolanacearum]|uniref:hypothetical protein n=1 Tax=Ralstonia pseudosolanacearum TaxID=1310165 RepID=UPI0040537E2C